MSLGAGRGRLVRLHLLESGLVTIGGVALGLALASLGLDLLKAWIPFPRLADAAIDGRLLAAAAVLAAGCTLMVGTLPALLALRCAAAPVLREGGPQSAGLARSRWRAVLVIAEVTLAVVVLVTASLLTQSLVNVARVPLGFTPEHTLSFRIPVTSSEDLGLDRIRIAETVVDRARTWPGVRAVGVADRLPLGGRCGDDSGHHRGGDAVTRARPTRGRMAHRQRWLLRRSRGAAHARQLLCGSLDRGAAA